MKQETLTSDLLSGYIGCSGYPCTWITLYPIFILYVLDENEQQEPPKKRIKEEVKRVQLRLPSNSILTCRHEALVKRSVVFGRMLSWEQHDELLVEINDVNEEAFMKLIHFLHGCSIIVSTKEHVCVGECQMIDRTSSKKLMEKNNSEQTGEDRFSLMVKDSKTEPINKAEPNKKVSVQEDSIIPNEREIISAKIFNTETDGLLHNEQILLEKFKVEDSSQILNNDTELENASQVLSTSLVTTLEGKECNVPCGKDEDNSQIFIQKDTYDTSGISFVIDLFICAEKFFIDELKEKCQRYLMTVMNDHTVVDKVLLSIRHNSRDLLQYSITYLLVGIKEPNERVRSFAELMHGDEKHTVVASIKNILLEGLTKRHR